MKPEEENSLQEKINPFNSETFDYSVWERVLGGVMRERDINILERIIKDRRKSGFDTSNEEKVLKRLIETKLETGLDLLCHVEERNVQLTGSKETEEEI